MMRMRTRRDKSLDSRETPVSPMQWRRLLAYLAGYKLRLLAATVGLVFAAGLSLVFPAVIQQVVDSVFRDAAVAQLDTITLALLGVFLLRSLASFVQTYNMNYIGEKIVVDLRCQLYAHLQTLSLRYYADRRVGELISRLASDVTVVRTVLTGNIATVLQQALTLVGAVAVMFLLNWRLTLFIIVLMPLVVVVGTILGRAIQRTSARVQDELAGATVVAEEVFQNIREVKSFVREQYEISRFNSAVDVAFRAAVKLLTVRSVFGPIIGFIAFSGLALMLWFGGREVLDGRLTAGELVAFLIYGLTVAGSFAGVIGVYSQLQEALGATKRVFEILDTQPDVRDAPHARKLKPVQGAIALRSLSFAYAAEKAVLREIDLEIAAGEIVALVGPSGAGKSTLFNLITRFYDPDSGAVFVDGSDIRGVTQASLREQIGIVPQETLLFGGSIRENILYGKLEASEAEMIAAARSANAHDFISQLPDGYDTVVGERGLKLSGGQRQRVAIARALLKDPAILLLDEATSSLDSESEQLVQEALGRLMRNRTTLIIAHRLSTVRVANRIAVLDEGRIIELGTHAELISARGLYARLYAMQFRQADLLATT
ncbi:MAG: ABC transporter transmembrane domain-containing protein [Chloroflexi bacterium]|nr:ABC transporter transmembrane domain-containing protein [Chloroflexota bacterium]